MAVHDASTSRRLKLVPSQLRWRVVWAFSALLMLALIVLAVASYRGASGILREQALQRLRAQRVNAAREIERYFAALQDQTVGLARDPSTLRALQELGNATAQLDEHPLTEPAKMRAQMESLKRFLEEYYRRELNDKVIDLHTLLLPQRSAVWLQASYLARGTDPRMRIASDARDGTNYDRSHATWDPVFRSALNRFGFEDLYLIDATSGRIVYSARKGPDFQTSLVDGPYAASAAGALFRELLKADADAGYRIVDVAPYPPLHGRPAAFAGAPILDDGRKVGVLVVQLSTEPLSRILSAEGQWSQVGLGETGELYLVGRGDSLMRSEPRFGPEPGTTQVVTGRDGTSVLRQRVESPATSMTSHTDEFQGEYTNYRSVLVLGSAGRLSRLNGADWTLVAEMSSAEALDPIAHLRLHTLWVTILLLLVSVLLILGVSAALATPVRALAATTVASGIRADEYKRRLETDLRPVLVAAAAASEGDFSQRIAGDDTLLGHLPQTLNRMWRNIGALLSHVRSSTTAAVESATQVQNAVRQLSHDAVQQTTEIATTNALLRDTRERLEALAAQATVADQAQPKETPDGAGRDTLAHAIAGMETLQKQTRALTLKMKRLGERSMEVSTVTTTIQQITAQANMLALNATIEASRAGEHGLGFKAVANDIRKLAARTEAVAKDLAELVTTIHSEAADAVDCIDRQADEIERETSLISDSDRALSHHRDPSVVNRSVLSAISATAAEQARVVGNLGDAMLRVAEFVRRTHVLSEQTVHSSAALLRMLSELGTQAQAFRVPAGSGSPPPSPAPRDVIELAPHEAVGNGRGTRA